MNACLISINICVAVHHSGIVTLLAEAKNLYAFELNMFAWCLYAISLNQSSSSSSSSLLNYVLFVQSKSPVQQNATYTNTHTRDMDCNGTIYLVRASSTRGKQHSNTKFTLTLTHKSTILFTQHNSSHIHNYTFLHLFSPFLFLNTHLHSALPQSFSNPLSIVALSVLIPIEVDFIYPKEMNMDKKKSQFFLC